MDGFHCYDCEVDTLEIGEYYMVNDHVWTRLAGMGKDDGMLCIGCLEARIGRTLCNEDFPDLPVNNSILYSHSDRIRDRIEQ